jgi:hypothetical protein
MSARVCSAILKFRLIHNTPFVEGTSPSPHHVVAIRSARAVVLKIVSDVMLIPSVQILHMQVELSSCTNALETPQSVRPADLRFAAPELRLVNKVFISDRSITPRERFIQGHVRMPEV